MEQSKHLKSKNNIKFYYLRTENKKIKKNSIITQLTPSQHFWKFLIKFESFFHSSAPLES